MKWGQDVFVPTPDLADILGYTDLNFENLYFYFFWIPAFQISGSQISKFPEIWLGPSLGRAGLRPWARKAPWLGWAGGPSVGPRNVGRERR